MREQIANAEASVEALRTTRNDRWYPQFHIAAKAGWINDPNGLSFFNDRYQVYFQHHPFGTEWGPMHWGHVSSTDLVTWKREPIALAPSLEEDKDGVFSGSAVVSADGKTLYAYYTGHRWRNGINEDDGNLQVQMMATSTDGINFEKHGMIVECPDGLIHFRDPKVWKQGDTWCMIFGACSAQMRGQVWLYTSTDMSTWTFDRVIFEDPNPDVFMLECPDMFPVGDKWVLSYCPMGPKPDGYMGRNGHNAGYVVGTWNLGETLNAETDYRLADWGHNYYAPQTFEAPDGRRIVFGWMGSFTTPLASQAEDGWSGQLTIPRVQTLDQNNRLISTPIAELSQLRQDTVDFGTFELGANENRVLLTDSGPIEVEAEFDLEAGTAERIGFNVHETPDGHHTFVCYDDLARRVVVDQRLAAHGNRGYRAAPFDGNTLKLRLFIDRGSVEVFVNDGEEVLTSFSFPAEGPRSLRLAAEAGSAHVKSLKIHRLRSIWE